MAVFKVINSKKAVKSTTAMRNVLRYVMDPEKTDADHCYVTGAYIGDCMNPDEIYESFIENKKQHHAESGRQYQHAVISFHAEDGIDADRVLEFATQFCDRYYTGHSVAIAAHNADNPHAHLVINTVSEHGKKLHKSKKDLNEARNIVDDLCREYGCRVTVKGQHYNGTPIEEGEIQSFTNEKYRLLLNSGKPSYLADCGVAVLRAVEKATSREQFVSAMESQGWQVDWQEKRKHIVFKNGNGDKVRGKNLLKTFGIDATKEGFEYEFERSRSATERAETERSTETQADRTTEPTTDRRKRSAEEYSQSTRKQNHGRGI